MPVREALFVLLVFVSNVIHAVTGFAGTMLAMPLSIRLIGVAEARAVLNIVGISCCVFLGFRSYKNVNWAEYGKIVITMLCGMALGIFLLKSLPVKPLMLCYGALIIVISIKNLFFKEGLNLNEKSKPIILICAGIIHGIFISGGALLVVYAKQQMPDKAVFRATLTPVWITLNSFLLIEQITGGSITQRTLVLSAVCMPFVIISVLLGGWFFNRIDERVFWRISCVLLLMSGVSAML